MPENMNNPKDIAERGLEIYGAKYKEQFEREYLGRFAAININDGSATLGDTASETLLKAKDACPLALFHLIRIGHSSAYEVGLAYRNASSDRLHR